LLDVPRAGVVVEACVDAIDAIDAALEAERGGAGRLELYGELLQGGVTPSAGLIVAVWDSESTASRSARSRPQEMWTKR
jgi:copper homeostasis protein CutC